MTWMPSSRQKSTNCFCGRYLHSHVQYSAPGDGNSGLLRMQFHLIHGWPDSCHLENPLGLQYVEVRYPYFMYKLRMYRAKYVQAYQLRVPCLYRREPPWPSTPLGRPVRDHNQASAVKGLSTARQSCKCFDCRTFEPLPGWRTVEWFGPGIYAWGTAARGQRATRRTMPL